MAWSAPVVVEKGMIYKMHRLVSQAFSGGLCKDFFGRAFEIFEEGRPCIFRSGRRYQLENDRHGVHALSAAAP
jgi:hypothetical protein